jgi:hypothetical protein
MPATKVAFRNKGFVDIQIVAKFIKKSYPELRFERLILAG